MQLWALAMLITPIFQASKLRVAEVAGGIRRQHFSGAPRGGLLQVLALRSATSHPGTLSLCPAEFSLYSESSSLLQLPSQQAGFLGATASVPGRSEAPCEWTEWQRKREQPQI